MPSSSFSSDPRIVLALSWIATLTHLLIDPDTLQVVCADASFRRYFRLKLENGGSVILMDAPPDKENVRPFIAVSALFLQSGVNVPSVLEENVAQGFLLLTDMGDSTYYSVMTSTSCDGLPETAWCQGIKGQMRGLYEKAIEALITVQKSSRADVLPNYDRARLGLELSLFPEWYLTVHKGIALSDMQRDQIDTVFNFILDNNTAQAAVYVHRDFHCKNLMLTPEGTLGILDFQDAVYGPITYDLVSLLRDAYVNLPPEDFFKLSDYYWGQACVSGLPLPTTIGQFDDDVNLMGLQRHLKILGIFARLCHRDGKRAYLSSIPRVLGYVRAVAIKYDETKPLLELLSD